MKSRNFWECRQSLKEKASKKDKKTGAIIRKVRVVDLLLGFILVVFVVFEIFLKSSCEL